MRLPKNLPFPMHVALARVGFRHDKILSRARILGAMHSVTPNVAAAKAWARGWWPESGRAHLQRGYDLPPLTVGPDAAPSSDDALHRDLIRLRNASARPGGEWKVEGDILFCPDRHTLFIGDRPFGPNTARPSDIDFRKFRSRAQVEAAGQVRKAKTAVLFDTLWLAYWHHFADALAPIAWINEIGIDPAAPLVVSAERKRLMQKLGLWEAAVQLAGGRKFITIKPQQVLATESAWVARMPEFHLPALDAAARAAPREDGVDTPRRIFFARSEGLRNQRGLLGEAEIAETFRRAGYFVVDPALLSVGAQRTLLIKATHIAGAHGSSFTNLLFTENPVRIGGFMSSAYRSTTFSALSAAAGHSFVTTVGAAEEGGAKAAFRPKPDAADRLLGWLESDAAPSEFATGR